MSQTSKNLQIPETSQNLGKQHVLMDFLVLSEMYFLLFFFFLFGCITPDWLFIFDRVSMRMEFNYDTTCLMMRRSFCAHFQD